MRQPVIEFGYIRCVYAHDFKNQRTQIGTMLEDSFGREVTGVRVSLTDRCNFDCVYCHNEGLGDTRGPMEPGDDEMGTDDVVRFLEVAREFDVGKVKFTGGEPMLREDLEEIIRRTPDGMETSLDDERDVPSGTGGGTSGSGAVTGKRLTGRARPERVRGGDEERGIRQGARRRRGSARCGTRPGKTQYGGFRGDGGVRSKDGRPRRGERRACSCNSSSTCPS